MIQAEYRRELNHSYMIIKNRTPQLTQQYAYRMIRENRIRRLLSCQERMVDGESCLYFEISSRQALEQFYDGRRMNAAEIGQILQAIVQVQEDMGEYLLDGASLLLDPVCIFIDVETEEMYFCFYPGWGKEQNPYTQLADFFLEHVDHGQEAAVNLAYQFYKLSKAHSFVLASFMPYVEKECAKPVKNSVQEEMVWTSPIGDEQESTAWEDMKSDKWKESEEVVEKDLPEKKSWYQRLLGGFLPGKHHSDNGKRRWKRERTYKGRYPEEGRLEEERSLWDVYADKLENKEAGETIYFSDLEKPAPKPVGKPFLVELGGQRRFCLESLPMTVGKLPPKAEILLEDASVSRIHARFFSENRDIWLLDLNSRNGTMINEKKLAPNEAVKVEIGDEIWFGRERFQFTFIDSQKE